MPNDNVTADLDILVTDELDAADAAVISDGLRAYYVSQAGFYDLRPLAVFVRDPQTGKVIGGLHGRSEFGLVYVAWFFLPEDWRRARIGSRVLAMAEEEGRRRGCQSEHRSEEHTSELQSQSNLVCRLLLEKKKKNK